MKQIKREREREREREEGERVKGYDASANDLFK